MRSPAAAPAASPTAIEGGLVIEVAGARVTVGRGADVSTLVTVLALLGGAQR